MNFDMRTEALCPISYDRDILMNKMIWQEDYMVPSYDVEDPMSYKHIALRRGPIILAQDNQLGYNVEDPIEVDVREDGYVEVQIPERDLVPYPHMIEVQVPLRDGRSIRVTDYASAGKLWTEDSKMAAWILTV